MANRPDSSLIATVPSPGEVSAVAKAWLRMASLMSAPPVRLDSVRKTYGSGNLLPALNVWQNVTLPMVLAGERPDRAWVS
jgi:putative ABC transport system ATP-binding protein